MEIDEEAITTDEAKEKSADELFDELSSSKDGLTREEAEEQLSNYGPNEIVEKKRNPADLIKVQL